MDATALIDDLQSLVPGVPLEPAASGDGTPAILVPKEHLVAVCIALRDAPSQNFSFLSDLTCVDYWPQSPRYTMVYNLVSLRVRGFPAAGVVESPKRARLLVRLDDVEPRVATLSTVYPRGRLGRARGLRPLRRDLRGAHEPRPHPAARRLGRAPAPQGLPG